MRLRESFNPPKLIREKATRDGEPIVSQGPNQRRHSRRTPRDQKLLVASGQRKRLGNRGAPKFNRSKSQAATLVGLTSKSLLELAIGIARGFIASGISRSRST